MTIETMLKGDKPECTFLDATILTGRGDLLATPYKVPYEEAGFMICTLATAFLWSLGFSWCAVSRSAKSMKARHEILSKDDGVRGLAFVTEDKLVMRIKSSVSLRAVQCVTLNAT
jgi:hypothetical protein